MLGRTYFDVEYPTENPSTPHLDQVLSYQFGPEMCDFLMMALGRTFFATNRFDQWHFMVFLYGPTGCGKSVILNLVEAFHGGPNYVGSFDTGYIIFLYTILVNLSETALL